MDKLSTHLQQMWATADLVDSVAPTTSVGRYDVSCTLPQPFQRLCYQRICLYFITRVKYVQDLLFYFRLTVAMKSTYYLTRDAVEINRPLPECDVHST